MTKWAESTRLTAMKNMIGIDTPMHRRQVLKGGAVGLGVLAAIHAMSGITPALAAFAETSADVSEAGAQNSLEKKTMKVLAINGSARKDGNTAILISEVFTQLHSAGIETELVQFAGRVIEPCRACFACSETGSCVFKKDGFVESFDKMKQADGILLGSPTYSADVSANMKAFLERAAVVADMRPGTFKHKVGASVAAARRGGALTAIDSMNHFFLNHEVFVVGSTYWNMAYGTKPGDVRQDEEGMANMKNLGQNMAFLLQKLKV